MWNKYDIVPFSNRLAEAGGFQTALDGINPPSTSKVARSCAWQAMTTVGAGFSRNPGPSFYFGIMRTERPQRPTASFVEKVIRSYSGGARPVGGAPCAVKEHDGVSSVLAAAEAGCGIAIASEAAFVWPDRA